MNIVESCMKLVALGATQRKGYSPWDRADIGTIWRDKASLYFSERVIPIDKEKG